MKAKEDKTSTLRFKYQILIYTILGFIFIDFYIILKIFFEDFLMGTVSSHYHYYYLCWIPIPIIAFIIYILVKKNVTIRKLSFSIFLLAIINAGASQLFFLYPVAFIIIGTCVVGIVNSIFLYFNRFKSIKEYIEKLSKKTTSEYSEIGLKTIDFIHGYLMFWIKLCVTILTILTSVFATAISILWALPFWKTDNIIMSVGLLLIAIYIIYGIFIWILIPLTTYFNQFIENCYNLSPEFV